MWMLPYVLFSAALGVIVAMILAELDRDPP